MTNDSKNGRPDQIDAVCREFKRAWVVGENPRIEDFAEGIEPANHSEAIRQLLRIELDLRHAAGDPVDLSTYRNRFPATLDSIIMTDQQLPLTEALGATRGRDTDGDFTINPNGGELRRLGQYELLERIGRGGMGIVFRARDVKLGKTVAVKVLPLNSAVISPSALARFQIEAKAAAQLEHPHVVTVFASDVDDGIYYYAMQYIRGQNLAKRISEFREAGSSQGRSDGLARKSTVKIQNQSTDRGSGDVAGSHRSDRSGARLADRSYVATFARWGIQIADALQHAHDLGIVHRDIKPSNLLIDEQENLYVADFGLAQVQGEAELTQSGDVIGTWRYMSPEQACAQRVVVDHRSDLFSLGATLYELFTLRRAFDGKTRAEILQQIAYDDPVLPRKINGDLPEELSIIVMKCLAKNPDERYQSAGELADDLRAYLRDEPIRARKPTLSQRSRRWARKHRSLVNSLVVASAIAIVASIGSLTYAVQAETESRIRVEAKNTELAAALNESEGRRLIALAALELPHDPNLSLALAGEGVRRHPDAEGRTALLAAFDANHQRLLLDNESDVGEARYSPDGKRIVTAAPATKYFAGPLPARIFDALTGKPLLELQAETTITSAVFDPTGRRVLTTSCAGGALSLPEEKLAEISPRVWDADRGVEIAALEGAFLLQTDSASFCPTGPMTKIVTPGIDHSARVYNAAGDLMLTLRGHTARVTFAGYSPDGTKIVTVSDDHTVRTWNAETGAELRKLDAWKDRLPDATAGQLVQSARFSPDSNHLLTCSVQLGVDLWDLDRDESTALGHGNHVAFSPDGEQFAIAWDDTIRVLDWHRRKVRCELVHEQWAGPFSFSNDGKRIVSLTGSKRFAAWDTESGRKLAEFRGHDRNVQFASFSPDSQHLVSGTGSSNVRVWSIQSGKQRATLPDEASVHPPLIAQDPDTHQIVFSTNYRHSGGILQLDSGELTDQFSGHLQPEGSAARRLVTHTDHQVLVRDGGTGESLGSFRQRLGRFLGATPSPSGDHVLIRTKRGPSWIWNWSTDERILVTGDHETIQAAAFHPTASQVACGGDDGVVATRDVTTGTELRQFSCRGEIAHLIYSPAGDRLLVINSENRGFLLDSDSLEVVTQFTSLDHPFNRAIFAADGKRILTYRLSTTKLACWDAETGDLIHQVDSPGGKLHLAVSKLGNRAILASDEAGLFVWDVRSGQIVRRTTGAYATAAFLDDDTLVAATALPFSRPLRIQAAKYGPPQLEIWNVAGETDRPDRTLPLHGAIHEIHITEDPNRILIGQRDFPLAVYDSQSLKPIGQIPGHAAPISFAALVPDRSEIVTCSYDTRIMIWDAKSLRLKRTLASHAHPITAAAISADGRMLASADQGGVLDVWNLAEVQDKPLHHLQAFDNPIEGCSLSAFNARVVAYCERGQWNVWDTANGKPAPWQDEKDRVAFAEFQPDGSRLLLVPANRNIKQFPSRIVSPSGKAVELDLPRYPRSLRFSPFGETVLGIIGPQAILLDAISGERKTTIVTSEPIGFATGDRRGENVMTNQGTSISVWKRTGDPILTVRDDLGFRTFAGIEHLGRDAVWVLSSDNRVRKIPITTDALIKFSRPLRQDERERFHLRNTALPTDE
ncbi:protein kinase domain-containing protein [Stieleria magnilauensis]|uniref:Serine/threonine-protein kinase PknB n=1 Tax=Stieleria magnilauensis TaxID=2527963 RepID=A0ABX5Y477_9BACT|nr:Serine/threonine-protein kinase PknB [Planctomycetes bacterium TBK1r]